jgi:hypothetical protein
MDMEEKEKGKTLKRKTQDKKRQKTHLVHTILSGTIQCTHAKY